MTSGGTIANQSGGGFEDFIEWMLNTLGYQEVEDKKWLFRNRYTLKGKYYAKQVVVGDSIYEGKKRRVDFFLVNNDIFPGGRVIEGKWQESGGSKEEALPYLCECIKKTGIPTIIAFDGGGCTQGAEKYIKSQVDKHLILGVWSMRDFQRAKNAGFFGADVDLPRQSVRQAESGSLWDGLEEEAS